MAVLVLLLTSVSGSDENENENEYEKESAHEASTPYKSSALDNKLDSCACMHIIAMPSDRESHSNQAIILAECQ